MKTYDIPFKGVYKPVVYDPHEFGASRFNNWKFKNGAITLTYGFGNLPGQTTVSDPSIRLLFHYASGARQDIVFVTGSTLRYVDILAFTEGSVVGSITPTTTNRIGWVRFRNRYLLATKDNGLWWYDPENRTARKAGIASPATEPSGAVGAATGLTGTYKGAYTYVNDQGHESSMSPPSGAVVVTDDKINWTGITVGPTGTVSRRFYRTVAGGALYLLHSTIADNTTTVITGDAIADTSLGVAAPSDHSVPTNAIRQIAATSERVYLVDDDGITLWASKIDPITGEPNWEAYPIQLSLAIPFLGGTDKMQCVIPFGGEIFAFGRLGIHRVRGDVGTGVVVEKVSEDGIFGPYSWVVLPEGILYLNTAGRLVLWNGTTDPPADIGEGVQALLNQSTIGPYDDPEIVYNPRDREVYLNTFLEASAPRARRGYIIDMNARPPSIVTNTWDFHISHYSPHVYTYYGAGAASQIVFTNSSFRYEGAQYSDQMIQFLPFSPAPGQDVMFYRVRFIIKAVPLVSSVPPTLRVEWSLNGSGVYKTDYVDLTKNFMVITPETDDVDDRQIAVMKNVEVPIHRVGKYLSLRLSSVNNAASINNGIEIYRIYVEADILNKATPSKETEGDSWDK